MAKDSAGLRIGITLFLGLVFFAEGVSDSDPLHNLPASIKLPQGEEITIPRPFHSRVDHWVMLDRNWGKSIIDEWFSGARMFQLDGRRLQIIYTFKGNKFVAMRWGDHKRVTDSDFDFAIIRMGDGTILGGHELRGYYVLANKESVSFNEVEFDNSREEEGFFKEVRRIRYELIYNGQVIARREIR